MRTGEHRMGVLALVGEAGTVPEPAVPERIDAIETEDADLAAGPDWGVSTVGPHGTMRTTPGNGPTRWIHRSDRFRTCLRITGGRAVIEMDGVLDAETSWPLYAAVGSAVSHRVRSIVLDARRVDVHTEGTACLQSVHRTADRFGVDIAGVRPPAA